MPVYQNLLFICNECGYQEVRCISDVRPDPNELKPCPKCGAVMESSEEESDITDKIFSSIKEILRK